MSELHITFLQFLATMLISMEYYLNRKKIEFLAKGLRNEIKKTRKDMRKEKEKSQEIFKKEMKINFFRIIVSSLLFYILFSLIYPDVIIYNNLTYFMILVALNGLCMVLAFTNIAEHSSRQLLFIAFISINRFLYLIARQKGIFVSLGFSFVLVSFIGRFINIMDLNSPIVDASISMLFVFCLMFLAMTFYGYNNLKSKYLEQDCITSQHNIK